MFPQQMRTGFSPGSPTGVDILPWVEATLKVLLEKSVEVGCLYSQDAGRDNLTSEDMVRALKYQAFHFLNEPDLNQRVALHMKRPGDETTPEGSGDETTPEGSGDETTPKGSGDETTPEGSGDETTPEGSGDDDESAERFTEASGTALSDEVNECCRRWDEWEPDTIQQQMLKRAIDRTIDTMG